MSFAQDQPSPEPRRMSFGSNAPAYDRYRPSFPRAVLAWGLGDGPLCVVDVGAGTGLMTEVLIQAGHRVIAVEPDARMRDQLRLRLGPGTDVRAGSAESLPLDGASADAIVAADSFHWFNRPIALAEMARVVRSGGTLLVVWSFRDERVPWVQELGRLLTPIEPESGGDHAGQTDVGPWFACVDEARFPFAQNLDGDRLVGLVATFSSVSTSPDRERILAQVASLSRSHPDLAGRVSFDLPSTPGCSDARGNPTLGGRDPYAATVALVI